MTTAGSPEERAPLPAEGRLKLSIVIPVYNEERLVLGVLRRVAAEAPDWLRPSGWLLVEVSPDRAREVSTILRRSGFRDVRSTKGPVPVSRVVLGRI